MESLLKVSTGDLCQQTPSFPASVPPGQADALETYSRLLLKRRNGFSAFEGALLVLPSETTDDVVGVVEWNQPRGWRGHYRSPPSDVIFFAQDVFGGQFGLAPNGSVIRLECESDEANQHSASLDAWAERIMEDYNFETGWELARDWQHLHGPLPAGWCLLGRRPFVLGGEYAVANLMAVPMRLALNFLGRLADTVRDVPDGSREVVVEGWPKPKGPFYRPS